MLVRLLDSVKDVLIAALLLVTVHRIVFCFYRLFLHPYSKYPGPFLAKVTTLYAAYYAFTGDMHLDIERCHKKYGERMRRGYFPHAHAYTKKGTFVRYGPNALIVNSPTGFHDIYGTLKKVKKSQSYKVHGPGNLLGIRDKKVYAKKKKIFQQGFSDSAIREHEVKINKEINTFCEKISENEFSEKTIGGWSNVKNMSLWCNYLTTDVVCKVVFTVSWDLLVSSANRGLVDTMSAVVHIIGVLHQSPVFTIRRWAPLIFLPTLAWCMKSLRAYTISIMKSTKEAREKEPSIQDFFRQFTEAKDPDTGEVALDSLEVRINSENFIAAGSDTTSSSMAATFFYLIRDPDAYSKVANEVRSAFPSAGDIRAGPALSNCVYLRAAISEALRCSPVVPQPLWREAEEGCIVDDEIIPAGLNVGAGIYSLHHREEAFPNPFKYDIERWIIDPEKDEEEEKERIKEMSKSFAPFSVGPRQCIAKNFALLELMLTFANVFWKLDFKNASGVDGTLGEGGEDGGLPGRERVGEFQLKSYFTSHMDGPNVQFKRREI